MTVDRPGDLEPYPERPENNFLFVHTQTRTDTHISTHAKEHPLVYWCCEAQGHRERCVLVHSVNYSAATLAPSVSKMNEPTYMPGYNPKEGVSNRGGGTVYSLGPF